jgi:hypothetical protein
LPPRDPDFFERTLEQLRADGIAVPMTGGMRGIWRIPPLGDEPPPPKSVTLSAEEEELLAEVGIKGVMEFLALGGPTWSHDYDAIAERMIREHAGTMSDKEILEEILLAIAISRHADRYGHS